MKVAGVLKVFLRSIGFLVFASVSVFAQSPDILTHKEFLRLHTPEGLDRERRPSVLIVIPNEYDPELFEAAYPSLVPSITENLKGLSSFELPEKNRAKSFSVVSDALNAKVGSGRRFRDGLLETLNLFSAPSEKRSKRGALSWPEVINLWESYSLDANFRFKIKPNFFTSVVEFPKIEDPENFKSPNPVELKVRTMVWGTPTFKTNAIDLSFSSPATGDQFGLLDKPSDLLKPEISTIRLPQTMFEVKGSILNYFKEAAETPENPRPVRLRLDELLTTLDQTDIPVEQAKKIVAALFTKANIDQLLDVLVKTKAFKETIKTLTADLEYLLQKQSLPIMIWIERKENSAPEFKFGIKGPEILEQVDALDREGKLLLRAESAIHFGEAEITDLNLSRKGLEFAMKGPSMVVLSFRPNPLHPAEEVLNEIPDPTVRKIVEQLLTEGTKNPNLRIDVGISIKDPRVGFKLPTRWVGDEKDGHYELDSENAKIDLPLMGGAKVSSVTIRTGKPDAKPFTIQITTGGQVFGQVWKNLDDFLITIHDALGDKPFEDVEKRVQFEIEKNVRALGNEKPIHIVNPKTSLDVKILDFKFLSDHDLKCDWFSSTSPKIPLQVNRKPIYKPLSEILPSAYDRIRSLPVNQGQGEEARYELTCEMKLPPELSIKLENIKSEKADIETVGMKLRYKGEGGGVPIVKLRLRAVYDPSVKRPVLIPVDDNLAEIIDSYTIGEGPGDLDVGHVTPHSRFARGVESMADSAMKGIGSSGKDVDVDANLLDALVQMIGISAKIYVGQEKRSQAEEELRKEFELNKPEIYQSLGKEIFDALNGSLPPKLLPPDSSKKSGIVNLYRHPEGETFDPQKLGVVTEIRDGVAKVINNIIETVPTGPQVQESVEKRVKELVGNTLEGRPDGLQNLPIDQLQTQLRTWMPKAKAITEDTIVHAVSGNAKEWNSAIQDSIVKPEVEGGESVLQQFEKTLNQAFFNVLNPKLINDSLKPKTQPVSTDSPSVQLPSVKKICIYPQLYHGDAASEIEQNFKAIGLYGGEKHEEGPTTLSSEPPRGFPLMECKERICSAKLPQVLISTDLIQDLLNTNRVVLEKALQEAIKYEVEADPKAKPASVFFNANDQTFDVGVSRPDALPGTPLKKSERFGISESAQWEFDSKRGFELSVSPDGQSMVVDFGFRFHQPGLFTDIDTEHMSGKLKLGIQVINQIDETGAVVGYQLALKGQDLELFNRPGFRFNFTNFFIDKMKEMASTFSTSVPLNDAIRIPGMKFKLGPLQLVHGEQGNDAIVTTVTGQLEQPRVEEKRQQIWMDPVKP